MVRTFEDELKLSYSLLDKLKPKFAKVLHQSPQLCVFESPSPGVRTSITVGSHGNEVVGIASLNLFLSDLLSRGLSKNVSLTIGLGNIEAARAGKRFVEKDLDRCFGGSSEIFLEEKIAREYEKWIPTNNFNLDLHQTVEPSESAFFVGPENRSRQAFASQIDEALPIMTFPPGSFSIDGSPLDEYLLKRSTLGLTVELGQKGFDEKQVEFGRKLMHSYLKACLVGQDKNSFCKNRIYKQASFVPNSPNRDFSLREGIKNLTPLKKGEALGHSASGALLCPIDGIALFPKYGDMAKNSSELCQIMVLAT